MNPRFSVHTTDKTSPRGFSWIWFLRIAQAVISLIVLGLAATNISSLNYLGCSVPGKIAWNLACAVLALLALAYLLFSSGTPRLFKLLPWWIFIQLALDALMFIFWIAAAGTSHFSCLDLCTTCNGWGYEIWLDRLDCLCESNAPVIFYDKRGMSPNPGLGLGSSRMEKRRSRSGGVRRSGTLVAREAMDAIMVILFFITLCSTAWWMWQNRNAGSTTTPSGATTNPNPENGQQVPMEMKQDAPYSGGPAPQYPNDGSQQYNNGIPQQQQQQGNYAPMSPVNASSPQGEYPQQGYPQQPQQAYQQQQGYPPQAQYPQQQQEQGQQQQQQQYPPQQQQQGYPEQQQQGSAQAYYGGPGAQQQQQQDIPNYPTPTPEMQAGRP